MDRDLNRLAAAISLAMIAVLFIVTCVCVKPYNIVRQEHILYVGSVQVTDFAHPALQPATSGYDGTGPVKTALGEALRVSPYDYASGTSAWACQGTGSPGEYICKVRWITGYSLYVAGIEILDGTAPWTAGNYTLIDATGETDGQPNPLHMADIVRLDSSTVAVTG